MKADEKKNPVISVVIPTRNRCHFLQETIASVLAQTFANWELIVIDDASEDDTWTYLSRLGDRRLKTIRHPQRGERCASRNAGLDVASGEFILFLDDDDLLPATALQNHYEAFVRYPGIIASIGGAGHFDESGARRIFRMVQRRCQRYIWSDLLLGWCPVSGQTLLRTETIRAVKGWDTTYNIVEDLELWLRAMRLGPVALLPDVVIMARVHEGQWRPPRHAMRKIIAGLHKRALKSAEGRERKLVERILEAKNYRRNAAEFYHNDQTVKALSAYLKVARLVPEALASPLTRRKLLTPIMRCLIGGQPVLTLFQRLFKRERVDYSCRAVVDSDGRNYLAPNNENTGSVAAPVRSENESRYE